MELRTTYFEHN